MHMELKEFVVHDRLPGPGLTIRGRQLALRKGRGYTTMPRWTDMALYEIVDPDSEWRYAFEKIAQSIVYHNPNGPCASRARGHVTQVGDIRQTRPEWWKLVPCEKKPCAPGSIRTLPDSTRVIEEQPEPSLYLCTDPGDILKQLYRRRGEISSVAAEVLKQAARQDPRIAEAWSVMRRV
jgi:hypothetical protein